MGHNNRILIKHSDGSIAWYVHLQYKSVNVEPGENVKHGQKIATCGNTGNTGNLPHLHFEVFRSRAFDYSDTIPISFRNTTGPYDKKGGLIMGEKYTALSYDK